MIYRLKFALIILAGRQTTNEELEEMLEQGNPAVFTQGVSFRPYRVYYFFYFFFLLRL